MLLNISVSTLEDLSFVSAEETIADLNDFEEFDFDIGIITFYTLYGSREESRNRSLVIFTFFLIYHAQII